MAKGIEVQSLKIELKYKDDEIESLKTELNDLRIKFENNITIDSSKAERLSELESEIEQLHTDKFTLEADKRRLKNDQGKFQQTIQQTETQLVKMKKDEDNLRDTIRKLEDDLQSMTEKDAVVVAKTEEIKQKEKELKELQMLLKSKEQELKEIKNKNKEEQKKKRSICKNIIVINKKVNEMISPKDDVDTSGTLERQLFSLHRNIGVLQGAYVQMGQKIRYLEDDLNLLKSSKNSYSDEIAAAEEEIQHTKKEYESVCEKLDTFHSKFDEIRSIVDDHHKAKQQTRADIVDVEFIHRLQDKLNETYEYSSLTIPENSPKVLTLRHAASVPIIKKENVQMSSYQWITPLASLNVTQKAKRTRSYTSGNTSTSRMSSSARTRQSLAVTREAEAHLPQLSHETPHVKIINDELVKLQKNLNCIPLLAYLEQDNHFTEDDSERICKEKTDLEKNRTFLNILKKKGPDAYDCFLKALESEKEWLYGELIKSDSKHGPVRFN